MARPGGNAARIQARSMKRVENPGKILRRVLSMIFEKYWLHMIIVISCVFINTFASIQGTLFTKTLIDDYIGQGRNNNNNKMK